MTAIELISSTTLTSSETSVTFSSIPQNYQDLVLNVLYTPSISGYGLKLRFAPVGGSIDTGSNYSHTRVYGGTSATSGGASNDTGAWINWSGTATTINAPARVDIFNYSNTSIYKTFISHSSGTATTYGPELLVDLWRSTSAIGTIEITPYSGNINSESKFTLFGIKKEVG